MRRSFVLAVLAPLAAAPAPAYAGPVTLWGCHGPAGAPLPFPHVTAARRGAVTAIGGGCAAPGGTLRLRFTTATPVPDDFASLRFSAPAGTSLERVLLGRRVTGPTYRARTTTTELESLPAPGGLDGVLDRAAGGTAVELDLRCETACDADASADFRFAAVTVRDDAPPVLRAGVPPRQVAGTFRLVLEASDGGLGLAAARATLDGVPAGSATFGLERCTELSPGDATIDLPLAEDCPATASTSLAVDSRQVADGDRRLEVSVADAAGNTASLGFDVRVLNHPPPPAPTPSPTPAPPRAIPPVRTPTPNTGELRASKRYTVSKTGALKVAASCPGAAASSCRVALKLTAKLPRRTRAATIASGRATIRPGRRATITLKLNASARKALTSRRTLRATLTLAGARPVAVQLRR